MKKLFAFLVGNSYLFAFVTAFLLVLTRSFGYVPFYLYFGLLVLCWFLGRDRLEKPTKIWWAGSTLPLFLVCLIAIPFSATFYDSVKVFGRVLPYALGPIGFLMIPYESRIRFKKGLYKGLIFGSLITSVILLSLNLIRFYYDQTHHGLFSYYFTYHNFTKPLQKHPTFLGLELLFALTSLFNSLREEKRVRRMVLIGCGLLFLVTTLVFVNSRSVLFLLGMVLLYNFFILIKRFIIQKKMGGVWIVAFSFLLLVGGVYVATKNSYVFYRFKKELSWDLTYQAGTSINSKYEGDSRLARWESAIKVIKEKPLWGHGNNSEVRVLTKQYLKDGLVFAYQEKYHSHNLFLSYFIEYGVWGEAILLLFFGSNLYTAIRTKQSEWLSLVLFIFFISVFDIYLHRSNGTLLAALFINLYVSTIPKKHLSSNPEDLSAH